MNVGKRTLWALAVLLISTAALGATPINETRPAKPDESVSINNISGSVTITGTDKSEIVVTGSLGKNTERLDITSGEGRTSIDVIIPQGAKDVGETILDVAVPVGSRVKVSTVSADITAKDLTGDLSAESVSGDITLEGASSKTTARSVSGDIKLHGTDGDVRVQTISGDAGVTLDKGSVNASTVSGDVTVAAGEAKAADLETVSGDVAFEGNVVPGGTLSGSSHSGDVGFQLPDTASAKFRLESFSGDVSADKVAEAETRGPGKSMRFETGAAEADVKAITFSGSVRVRLNRRK